MNERALFALGCCAFICGLAAIWKRSWHAMGFAMLVVLFMATGKTQAQTPDMNAAHNQAKAFGQANNATTKNKINTGTASSTVPNYTSSDANSAYFGSSNLGAPTAAMIAACRNAPPNATYNGQSCAAVNFSQTNPSQHPNAGISSSSPIVIGGNNIANNPGAYGAAVSGNYSACAPQTVAGQLARYDFQTCNDYLKRELNTPCNKRLDVQVSYSPTCPANAIEGPTPVPGSGSLSAPDWTCKTQTNIITNVCNGDDTYFAMVGLCYPVTGDPYSPTTIVTLGPLVDVPATVTIQESDNWDNQCFSNEVRVPPGMLLPDGDNSIPATVGSLGIVNKCERTTSTCAEPFETRWINFQPVTRACWNYSNTFSCVNNDPRSDCNQPKFGACTEQPGSPTCVEFDKDIANVCLHREHTFQCRIQDATTSQVTNCGSQSYCTNGQCWDTGHPPDSDFARSVTMLEAGREAGRYMDPATLTVFKGFDNRCVKKLFGLVDCCNKGGTQFGMFTNLSLALAAAGTVSKAATSSYTFDALFVSDAPNWVVGGFSSMFGSGSSSALAGVIAGDLSVSNFMVSLVPGPWTIAILAIQYSGIMSCDEKEKVTALKKDQRLCHDIGETCSKKLLFGACLERTHTYCCFNSLLARIINEQGRPQLGRGWGDAKNPDCGGFTPSQLQSLNFAAMDLKEFYETLRYDVAGENGPNTARTSATIACKVAGKC